MATHLDLLQRRPTDEAIAALSQRAGLAGSDTPSGALHGGSLLDHARASLRRASINPDGRTAEEVFAAAFTQGATDFPVLLENVAHKAIQKGFATQQPTWRRFCAVGSVSDFRDHPRYRDSSIGNLKPLSEHGEYVNGSIPDAERARVRAGTKGLILNISRQALVNDDLAALTDPAKGLGESAGRTLESDVYAVLALNGGLGPVLEDGKTLFHASRGNYVAPGSGSAPSYAAFMAAVTAMASVRDVGGNDYLALRPSIWHGPLTYAGIVRQLNEGEHFADPVTALAKANGFRNTLQDIVGTPRLTGTAWRMFADRMEAPVLEVSFLNGVEEPTVDAQPGFDLDGVRFRVAFDYGVTAVDWRGAYMNAGA
ncbi:MAG: hypothetical protein JSS57_25470 [Proteobacteria bacterium]|nr:hypothetical protein [Pseudomonadota bacterium]